VTTLLLIGLALVLLAGLVPVLAWSALLRSETLPSFSLLAAVALFATAFLIAAGPWLSGAVTIPWDAKAQFYPQLQFLAQSLARGESPFWTPFVFAGWPQIADPQSLIFSPLHFLLALVDANPSFGAADGVAFAMLFIGGLGLICFFRDRGWHPAGALVAALSFAFGGAAASRIQHIGEIVSLSFLPLALWLTARALTRSSAGWGIAAGLAAALMVIGRDQVALLGLYLLAGFVVAHWIDAEGHPRRLRASIKPLAAMTVTGLVVCLVSVLMTALLAADSNRPAIDYISAGRGSLHPAHLLTLFFADLYGAADPAVPYWGPPSMAWGPTDLFLAQNMGQLYAGALPLVAIAGFGMIRGALWSREIRFFTIATALVLLYALGWYTPAFRAMYELLPGVAFFRRPADAAFPLGMLIAVLGGYLVHRWVAGTIARARPLHRAAEIAIALAIVGVTLAVAFTIGTIDVSVLPLVIGIGWAAAGIAVLVVSARLRNRPMLVALIVTAFSTADLAWNNAPNESTGLPPAMYGALRPDTTNETIALLKSKLKESAGPDRRDRVELTGIAYHWPNASLVHGLDHLFGHNPLRLAPFAAVTGVGDTIAVADQRKFAPLFPSYRSVMADLFGLRFIATGVPVEQIDNALRPGDLNFIARTGEAYVYENPRAFPRVLLATDWRVADFDALIRSGGWPAVDPRHTVLLTHAPPQFPTPIAADLSEAKVSILSYRNTEVTIQADAPEGGVVVLNDVWHPWWRAEVDGAPAEILKANVLFRAVAVGPGRHVVKFEFAPFSGALHELKEKLAPSSPRPRQGFD
jgi:Dolichyl-phosphate-mannose-protein mannosyltransferase